ncbi:MAG: hypothetical protein Q8P62_04325 [Candidatus Peregrinibacteria bacterium]|nr:hypothetical protein [Candidatus Peregrinibacteria bacterium]
MLNKLRTGLALGGFVAFCHAIWAIMVAANYAKPMMDFIFKLHMVPNPHVVGQFDLLTALSLVGLTAVVGFVAGFVFAFFYNWAHMSPKKRK